MKKCKPYLLLAILLQAYLASFCQEAKIVALTKYTQNEGLSSYYVTKIIQDSRGFLWIGTQEGLNLFDGRSFQVFSRQAEEKNHLGGSFVSDIVEDKKRNLLWVLTSYGDICGIDLDTRIIKKRITIDKDKKPLSGKWIRSLAIQGDILWIAGLGVVSCFNIEANKYLVIDMLRKAGMTRGDCNISRLTVDKQNRLWLFSDGYGIIVLNKKQERLQTIRAELSNGVFEKKKLRFWDLAFDQNLLYVGTSWGLRVLIPGEKSITYLKNSSHSVIDTVEILSMAFSSPNQVFFSTPNRFCSYNFLTGKTEVYKDEDTEDDWLTLTYQVFYDNIAQKIWLGTQTGLASFEGARTPFNAFSRSSKSATRIKHAFSLLPVGNDEVYCGDENGLFRVITTTKEIEKIDNGSSNLLLFKDKANNIFLSNKNGFYLVKGKVLRLAQDVFPSLKQLEGDQFSCAIQFNDSIILFGSVIQKGLSVWNTRTGKLKIFHNDSVEHKIKELSIINNLYKSISGKVFILTEKSVISFDPVTETSMVHYIRLNAANEPFANFMDMGETTDRYWIATYGDGLIETDKNFQVKKIISTKEGLSNNCVYKVFPYNNRSIIATTNNGLSIIDCKNYNTQKYFRSDGLHSSFFEQVCGCRYGDKIYAGGVDGFTIIDPAILYSNPTAPKLYLNKVTIQTRNYTTDTTNIFLNQLRIPNNTLQVTISVSGLNYKNPGRTSYAYKISEDQGDWIDLGTQNFINLPGLPPGKYTLLFKSANEAGVWNEKPLSLTLIYLPKWYQTLSFKLLLILTTIGLLYAFYRYRLGQVKKQQQIRKDIASDLHDDIGSVLNSVKIFTHLAKREPEKDDHLNRIEESLTQASSGLRDMIWVLDDSGDTVYEVMERIKKYALPVCQAEDIQFDSHIKSGGDSKPLTKTMKRNFLLIAKESINNSIKYSNCKNILVTIEQTRNSVTLLIKDDGKGFDTSSPSTGNGLKNIYHRAGQIHSVAEIISSPGAGTIVLIAKK